MMYDTAYVVGPTWRLNGFNHATQISGGRVLRSEKGWIKLGIFKERGD